MAFEIERKFLLRGDPASRLGNEVGEHLRQGYLAIDQAVEVRVRIGSESAAVTVKAGRGIVEVGFAAARRAGRADVAEVDIYHGSLAGLSVAEVEFASESSAAEFVPPHWFGRELTGDDRWSNAQLARHGLPEEFINGSP